MFTQIRFEITAGLYTDFFNYLVDNEFIVQEIIPTQLGFTALCHAKDYKKIAYLAKKFQCKIKVIEKNGMYFKINKYLKRKGLLIGVVIFMLLTTCFNNIIWRIDVNVNDINLKNQIGVTLYENGIYSGAVFSQEQANKAIQEVYIQNKEVAYISLNFYKGILECVIHESDEKLDYTQDTKSSDIISSKNGIITMLNVYNGFSNVQLNQSVAQGDILVSATALNAKNEVVYSPPRAYIEARCNNTYSATVNFQKKANIYTGEVDKDIYIQFLNKEIKLNFSKEEIKDKAPDKTVINHVNIFGFKLPFTMKTNIYYAKQEIDIDYDEINAESVAKTQVDHIIREDVELKNIFEKIYETKVDENSVTVICYVDGIYKIN